MLKYRPRREKTCLRGVANNKGSDQPAHPRSLISTFVIPLLQSIIARLDTGEISIFLLVSLAEDTGLKLALSETPKKGFLATRPIYNHRTYLLPEMSILREEVKHLLYITLEGADDRGQLKGNLDKYDNHDNIFVRMC